MLSGGDKKMKSKLLDTLEILKKLDYSKETENEEIYGLIEESEEFFNDYASGLSMETVEAVIPEEDEGIYDFSDYMKASDDIPLEELPDADFSELELLEDGQKGNTDTTKEKVNSTAYKVFKMLCGRYNFKCWNEQIYVYNGKQGRYIYLSDSKLKVLIRQGWDEKIQEKLSKYVIAEIVERLKTEPSFQVDDDYFNCYDYLMNFRNGVLNLITGKFLKHSPKYGFTHCVQAEYYFEPEGGQTFVRFIRTAMQGDVQKERHLQEIVGYILSEFHKAKKVPMLIGAPNSGKSTLNSVISALTGSEHVANVPLHRLHERFIAAHLSTKKINICSEINDEALSNIESFKAITGNDELMAEYKGKDHFSYKSKIKLLFSGNSMPKLKNSDVTSAFFSRLTFVNFNYTVPEGERDLGLEDKLLTNDRSYIVAWAVEGIKRLMKKNFVFSESQESIEYKKRYIIEQNNTLDFIKSNCILQEGARVHMRDIYDEYIRYCYQNCFNPFGKDQFFSEIEKQRVSKEKFRMNGSKPLWGYKGIAINKEITVNKQQENVEQLERGA